ASEGGFASHRADAGSGSTSSPEVSSRGVESEPDSRAVRSSEGEVLRVPEAATGVATGTRVESSGTAAEAARDRTPRGLDSPSDEQDASSLRELFWGED